MSPESSDIAAITTKKIGFDNEKYLDQQLAAIYERVEQCDNKLYLEFGGKIIFDYHASRVLPGFDPNVKMRLLSKLKDKVDIVICIYAGDIERGKVRADFGITYDADAMKLIDDLKEHGLSVKAVVITRFSNQPSATIFKNKLERRGINVFTHSFTNGYPTDVDLIVSDEGYGANAYIETEKPIVVVTAPGPGSGKLATCLSQLYHEHKKGIKAGYAKFETFPIWSIPLKHTVNIAYESATADLKDFNCIDPFHLEAYGEKSINYNRDVEVFPVVKRILDKITGGKAMYQSPTDMGVNRAGFGIVDDAVVQAAARQEIIRRYFSYQYEYAMGLVEKDTVERAELIMKEIGASPEERNVVLPARAIAETAEEQGKGHEGISCGAAIELHSGEIVTGMNSPLMHAASSLIFNAIKKLANVPADIHLLAPNIIESIGAFKMKTMGAKTVSLDLNEALIALSISAATNQETERAVEQLEKLKGCEMHMTHIPTPGDEAGLRKLGVNLTCDPAHVSHRLFAN